MKKRLYINPYRHTKTGAPVMQKSPPRLKSAFADRRKTRIHRRSELRPVKLLAHIGGVWVVYSGGFFGYSVSAGCTGIPIGAASRVQANAIAANVRNQEVFGGVVDGAEWHETMRHVYRDGEWEES